MRLHLFKLFLSSFFKKHQKLYYTKLNAYHDGDIFEWLDFFLTGVIETANNGIIISKKFVLFVIEIWKKYKHLLKENLIAV